MGLSAPRSAAERTPLRGESGGGCPTEVASNHHDLWGFHVVLHGCNIKPDSHFIFVMFPPKGTSAGLHVGGRRLPVIHPPPGPLLIDSGNCKPKLQGTLGRQSTKPPEGFQNQNPQGAGCEKRGRVRTMLFCLSPTAKLYKCRNNRSIAGPLITYPFCDSLALTKVHTRSPGPEELPSSI